MVSAYKELAEEGKLKIKIRALCEITETNKDPIKEVDRIAKLAADCNNDYFRITGIKVFLDGVVEALTTWTLNPYTAKAGKGNNYYGYIRWNEDRKEELTGIIKYANEKGLQVHMHAIGEGAADYALDCYEAAYKELPDIDARNAVAHLTYVTEDMPKRFADNKVIAVVNPTWSTWKYGTKEDEIKVYGETEARNTYPDEIRGVEETIDGITSLKCLTRNPAYLLKEENNLGSIEVGKAADFTIFNVDLTEDNVVTDVSVTNATLLSVFSNGKMLFPANQLKNIQ